MVPLVPPVSDQRVSGLDQTGIGHLQELQTDAARGLHSSHDTDSRLNVVKPAPWFCARDPALAQPHRHLLLLVLLRPAATSAILSQTAPRNCCCFAAERERGVYLACCGLPAALSLAVARFFFFWFRCWVFLVLPLTLPRPRRPPPVQLTHADTHIHTRTHPHTRTSLTHQLLPAAFWPLSRRSSPVASLSYLRARTSKRI